ncbi:hypothetical protein Ato02nite_059860 [Paractinoplanes toevensis]|uniref:Uncharacterized protein n=1 Tax=Paractinoplanes toevensis TaxID=571911 RepID=A0A919TEL5_9ACTN|nr:hypothetical protein Ato02nite_059860 [Actinoplanes toevensis]
MWHPCHCRPWQGKRKLYVMAIGIALFFLVITLFSIAGRTADTRDSADWKPTNDGSRTT